MVLTWWSSSGLPSGSARNASWMTASAARNAVQQAVSAAVSARSRRWATRIAAGAGHDSQAARSTKE
jgi:hypothetical protein